MTLSRRNIKIVAVVIAALIVLGILVTGIVLGVTAKTVSSLPPGQASQDRLTTLDQVMTSFFGPKWAAILLAFAVGLLIILFLLYLLTKQEITIGDSAATGFSRSIIALVIIITLGIISAAIVSLVDFYKSKRQENETLGDFAASTNAWQVIELVAIAIGCLVAIGIGMGIWIWWRKRKRRSKSIR